MGRNLTQTASAILSILLFLHSSKAHLLSSYTLTNDLDIRSSVLKESVDEVDTEPEPVKLDALLSIDETVPRGQSFFYTNDESLRLNLFQTWRPESLVGRSLRNDWPSDASDDDLFVSMQTTSESMWTYVPLHLLTTFRDFPAFGIYSNFPDSIAGAEILNVFAPINSTILESSPDFESYEIIMSIRDSHIFIPPDQTSVAGIEKSTKYQLLPMIMQTYTNHPNHKWYIFTADRTTLFAKNSRSFFSGLDSSQPYYLGKAVLHNNYIFASLQAGIVLSQGLSQRLFESTIRGKTFKELVYNDYMRDMQDECCGDYMLAKLLKNEFDITVDTETSGSFFQSDSLDHLRSRANNWCAPIGSLGNQCPRDIELSHEYQSVKGSSNLLFSDFYSDFMKPYLPSDPQINWDNGANDSEFSPRHDHSTDAHKSQSQCREACNNIPQCVMFRYDAYTQYCGIGFSSVALGSPILEYSGSHDDQSCEEFHAQCGSRQSDQPMMSEWHVDRIRDMRRTLPCDFLHDDSLSEGVEYGSLDQVEGWWHRAKLLASSQDVS